MIYPKFMVVNKTMNDIIVKGQLIKALNNDYLMHDFHKERR